ncbi:protein-tyrosine phosphatase family protein [Paenibacillus spongiae]|uniref:Protein tyrosine phosphatase n=1 Tax=Paenibacillus spongiae TaxID=2909671 RepID=A0ABY5S5I8_9BACL|nr:protein tyrosine phosphatase [Paenibacillus spongiae]UVI29186.1 protein tyrosine phosphatase [Paenibacillus spongiae]
MTKNYQALVGDQIFFGAASDAQDMVEQEQVDVLVDLRGDAAESADGSGKAKWVHIPCDENGETPLEQSIQSAVDQVVNAYHNGQKVGFHCGGGGGKAGSVAIGTLIALGTCATIEEAETMTTAIRDKVKIRPEQRAALEKLYQK